MLIGYISSSKAELILKAEDEKMKLTTYNKILDNRGGEEIATITNLWPHCDKKKKEKGDHSTRNAKLQGFAMQLNCWSVWKTEQFVELYV